MNSTASHVRILIVEDNAATSELLSVYLEREGFSTIVAGSGRQALALAAQHHVTLAIVDVMLPDLDGWEVCRQLRSSSSVPILMVSALGQAHQRLKGFQLGADDYVTKPFSFSELVARVKAILRRTSCASRPVDSVLSSGGLLLDLDNAKSPWTGKNSA